MKFKKKKACIFRTNPASYIADTEFSNIQYNFDK